MSQKEPILAKIQFCLHQDIFLHSTKDFLNHVSSISAECDILKCKVNSRAILGENNKENLPQFVSMTSIDILTQVASS